MGTTFEQSSQRYMAALQEGASIDVAIDEANLTNHRDQVFDAAVAMLEADGVIDMKRLASASGISRASLYRYYPDKLAVEAEVAACLVRRMTTAAASHEHMVHKLRAALEALVAYPAGAAALGPVVAAADVSVIATSSEVVIGHAAAAPVIVGFAAMAASAYQRGQMSDIEDMLEIVIAQFELSMKGLTPGA